MSDQRSNSSSDIFDVSGIQSSYPFLGGASAAPYGFSDLLGPLGRGVESDLLAADCALAAKEPFATVPPLALASAD